MKDRLSQGAQPAVSPLPLSISWQDPARHFAIEFQVRSLRVFEEVLVSSNQNAVGVLLGSTFSGPRAGSCVVDVACLTAGPSAEFPLPSVVLEQIKYWRSQTRISAVGLWFFDKTGGAEPQAKDLANLASCFDHPIPLILVRSDGKQAPDARVCLWSPADRVLQFLALRFPVNLRVLTAHAFQPFAPQYLGVVAGGQQFSKERPAPDNGSDPSKVQNSPVAPIPEPSKPSWLVQKKWTIAWSCLALLVAAIAWIQLANSPPAPVAARTIEPVRPESTPSGIGLEVIRKGSDLQIRWDRMSSVLQTSRAGVLRIIDGTHASETTLPVKQLLTGHILYVPKSSDIDISLALITPAGRVDENVRVMLAPAGSSAPESIAGTRSYSTTGSSQTAPGTQGSVSTDSPVDVSSSTQQNRSRPYKTFVLPPTSAITPPSPTLSAGPVDTANVGSAQPSTLPAAIAAQTLPPRPQPVDPSPARPQQRPAAALGVASASERIKPAVAQRSVPIAVPETIKRLLARETTVELKLLIDEQGHITDVQTSPASGVQAYLTNLASSTVREWWRFGPATLDGKPVKSEHILRFKFRGSN